MLVAQNIFAQYAGFKPIADVPAFKAKFTQESSKIRSLSCQFIQEKSLEALSEKIQSNGKFYFKKDNKVRIEYLKPFSYLLVMNGDKMLVKDENKTNQVNTSSNKLFKQINRILLDCLQGNVMNSVDFSSKAFESNSQYLIELKPKTKTLSGYFKSILLWVDKKDYTATLIQFNESGGDKTSLQFVEKKINPTLADTLFAVGTSN